MVRLLRVLVQDAPDPIQRPLANRVEREVVDAHGRLGPRGLPRLSHIAITAR